MKTTPQYLKRRMTNLARRYAKIERKGGNYVAASALDEIAAAIEKVPVEKIAKEQAKAG